MTFDAWQRPRRDSIVAGGKTEVMRSLAWFRPDQLEAGGSGISTPKRVKSYTCK